jgi:hypothetical protein
MFGDNLSLFQLHDVHMSHMIQNGEKNTNVDDGGGELLYYTTATSI